MVAAITQLVEWLAVNQHVTGSSPVGGVILFVRILSHHPWLISAGGALPPELISCRPELT